MSTPDIEEFGRKVRRAQIEIEQIRATASAGGVSVEVDASGHLVAVNTPDEQAIITAYQAARDDVDEKVKAAAQEVVNDSVAQTISSLVDANKATQEAARVIDEDAAELAWEEMRRDPLRRRRNR